VESGDHVLTSDRLDRHRELDEAIILIKGHKIWHINPKLSHTIIDTAINNGDNGWRKYVVAIISGVPDGMELGAFIFSDSATLGFPLSSTTFLDMDMICHSEVKSSLLLR
jgi:hypothetical protein